ncbi:MAG: sensor histidine kinase [Chloroflexi bacterium]|nr:sensor histidine kinase [Chloroflexota bacterium]
MADLLVGRLPRWSLSFRFAAASALVLLVGASVLGTWITRQIEESVLHRAATSSAMFVEALVSGSVQEGNVTGRWDDVKLRLDRAFGKLTSTHHVVAIKVWGLDGTILYSTDPSLIGRVFASDGLRRALEGEVVSKRSRLDADENASERASATELIETYIPIRDQPSGEVIAVSEFYQPTELLDADLLQARLSTWILIAVATVAMYVLLFSIVRSGSDTIERQRRQLAEAVDQLSVAMRRLREVSAARAETDEAVLRRIARDLHDGLAQDLAAALVTMNGDGPGQMTKAAIDSALREVRALARGLAAPDLAPLGLGDVIDQACDEHERKTGQVAYRDVSDLPTSAPEQVKIAVYRVLQEALSNAFRHAGAGVVRVRAAVRDGGIEIECLDDGPGIRPDSCQGLGLRSMRERVELLDGSFSVQPRPGGGTTLRAHIPLVASGVGMP